MKPSKKALSKAVSILKKGGVVICPTDTVYGFLADATNKKAVEKIYKIKKRPKSKPLPIFVKDINMAKELAFIDTDHEKVLKKYWPGKYTFVVKLKVAHKNNTIALRVPKHPFLQKLLKKINKPLAQTSVNISGEETLTRIQDIVDTFGKEKSVSLIIDGGDIKKGKSSKIIDISKNTINILRK